MNKYKKIGLTAIAGSLIANSDFAGELGVSGSAKVDVEQIHGGADDTGKTFAKGNSVTLRGSGELDNSMIVSPWFAVDKVAGVGQANAPCATLSVSGSSDS